MIDNILQRQEEMALFHQESIVALQLNHMLFTVSQLNEESDTTSASQILKAGNLEFLVPGNESFLGSVKDSLVAIWRALKNATLGLFKRIGKILGMRSEQNVKETKKVASGAAKASKKMINKSKQKAEKGTSKVNQTKARELEAKVETVEKATKKAKTPSEHLDNMISQVRIYHEVRRETLADIMDEDDNDGFVIDFGENTRSNLRFLMGIKSVEDLEQALVEFKDHLNVHTERHKVVMTFLNSIVAIKNGKYEDVRDSYNELVLFNKDYEDNQFDRKHMSVITPNISIRARALVKGKDLRYGTRFSMERDDKGQKTKPVKVSDDRREELLDVISKVVKQAYFLSEKVEQEIDAFESSVEYSGDEVLSLLKEKLNGEDLSHEKVMAAAENFTGIVSSHLAFMTHLADMTQDFGMGSVIFISEKA